MAKATYKPSSREKQLAAAKSEKKFAKAIGGERTTGNKPVDVVIEIDGVEHGFEVKTLVDNKNNKITMHPPSLERKRKWLTEKPNRQIHTVIYDERDRFQNGVNRDTYSGRRTYYRKGIGSFRIKRDFAMSIRKIVEKFKGQK